MRHTFPPVVLLLALGGLHANDSRLHVVVDPCFDDKGVVLWKIGQPFEAALLLGRQGRPMVSPIKRVLGSSKRLELRSVFHDLIRSRAYRGHSAVMRL